MEYITERLHFNEALLAYGDDEAVIEKAKHVLMGKGTEFRFLITVPPDTDLDYDEIVEKLGNTRVHDSVILPEGWKVELL